MKNDLNIIPDKSHTFSKAHHQYPTNISPQYATNAYGCRLQTDKGEYIDWSMGIGPVIKGYSFKKFNEHLYKKIEKGLALSIPYEYEFEVANKLITNIKFGDQVRFARNGSDVTSAAVRLARHYTNKDLIICNGYHGWQDWYIGATTRNSGVPRSISNLTKKIDGFSCEQLERSFNQNKGNIACLIIEPMIGSEPDIEFLKMAKSLCENNEALLIFDEAWTGFRCHKEGAIGYTGIIPDLVCYGKALGNGVPVSAIVGRKSLMKGFEEVFFSFTHAADPIGLASADFMIDYLDTNFFNALTIKTNVMKTKLVKILQEIEDENLRIKCTSYPGKLVFTAINQHLALEIKTFVQKEFLSMGMLFNMFIALCEDHEQKEIDMCCDTFEIIVKKMNSKDFNLQKETEQHLVKAVFRPQT